MTQTIPDLWPPAVFTAAVATPIAILRRQGEALGEHTQNFVLGEVETKTESDGKQFRHHFWIVAPLIRYRKELLRVTHVIQFYPATVSEQELTKEQNQNYWSKRVNNEQELQEALREFFALPRVVEIVQAVINLSNDVASPEVA